MNFPHRRPKHDTLPGQVATVRFNRNLAALLPKIGPGDLVVTDQLDLDAETARSLAARRPFAVLNAASFISGRFANLGPAVLADAGVRLLEGRREQVLALRDGQELRLHEGTLYDGAVVVLDVEELSRDQVSDRMDSARSGMAVQLTSFAHGASELLNREEDLLLHGTGLPELRTGLRDRVVVVVGPSTRPRELKRLRGFLRATRPVVIGVDAGLDVLAARRVRADVAVLSAASTASDAAVRRCREVVLCEPGRTVSSQVEKLRLPLSEVVTRIAPVDVALLLARTGRARLVVPVGTPGTLEELIDRDRSDQASNVLTRMRLGAAVVDGSSVPRLLAARRRPWRVVAGVLVLAAAIGALVLTPTGHRWRDDLGNHLPSSWGLSSGLSKEKATVAARDRRIRQLEAEAKRSSGYLAGTANAVVRGTLAGRTVSLIGLPGADPATLVALRGLLTAAGAQVGAQVAVLPATTSSAQDGLVDALTSQMVTQTPGLVVPAGADGYQRLGALLSRAAAVPPSAHVPRAPYDTAAVAIGSGLRTAGLVSSTITWRGALTLLVTGTHGQDDADLARLAAAYGAQVPTVVAGPASGPLSALRASASKVFSTVDGIEATDGRVAAVLALAVRAQGRTGAWGPAGHDGPVPSTS
ncbi:MAG: putative cytokinetic ring protein SteA [Marmoricola sp.]